MLSSGWPVPARALKPRRALALSPWAEPSRCGRPQRGRIQPQRNVGFKADARSVFVVGGQHPLDSAIEPVGGATDVCGDAPHIVELTSLDVLELRAEPLDRVQPRL